MNSSCNKNETRKVDVAKAKILLGVHGADSVQGLKYATVSCRSRPLLGMLVPGNHAFDGPTHRESATCAHGFGLLVSQQNKMKEKYCSPTAGCKYNREDAAVCTDRLGAG